jgi:FkbH-like protein
VSRYYIFRNFTLESFFANLDATYSPYGDVLSFDNEYEAYIWFYHPPFKANVDELVNELRDYSVKLELVRAKLTSAQTLILFQLDEMLFFKYTEEDRGVQEAVTHFNEHCRRLAVENSNIKTVSLVDFARQYALNDLIDWKFYYLSQMNFNPKLAGDFQRWFTGKRRAIEGKRKKCLALDLDNTLWGGVLGEEGVNGIQLGNTYPGNAYRDFQAALLEASRRGVILAVCSKNNEEDVFELWRTHPALLLTQEHFAAWRINWQEKHHNLQEIAEELNIGLNSFVFLDDNPVERELVKSYLPEVIVPDFPTKPYLLREFFQRLYEEHFYLYQTTKEDLAKTAQYSQNSERRAFQQQFSSIEDYWRNLEMEFTISVVGPANIARIAQMTQKTNQFNLTTKRYVESELDSIAQSGGWVHCLSVKDKFGDNGITAVSIVTFENQATAVLDSYLLSCRILGRGIETAFLKELLNRLYFSGVRTVKAAFLPTAKNQQVESFYEKLGFEVITQGDNDEKLYQLEMKTIFTGETYYKLISE